VEGRLPGGPKFSSFRAQGFEMTRHMSVQDWGPRHAVSGQHGYNQGDLSRLVRCVRQRNVGPPTQSMMGVFGSVIDSCFLVSPQAFTEEPGAPGISNLCFRGKVGV